METIELSGRTGQEVYEELKHRLEGMYSFNKTQG